MANHPLDAQLFYGGTWHVVTSDVSQNDPVKITQGGGEVSAAPKPSSIQLTFEDPNAVYDPDLPTSPLYGLAGRNTAIAVDGQVAEVSSWQPGLDVGRPQPMTQITAEGPLRRVGTWTDPVMSAYARRLVSIGGITDLWTLEDANLVSSVGGDNAINVGVDVEQKDSPGGGSTSMRLTQPGGSLFTFLRPSSTDYQLVWAFKVDDTSLLPSAGGGPFVDPAMIVWFDPVGYTFAININSTQYVVVISDPSGAVVVNDAVTFGAEGNPDQWVVMAMKVFNTGGTISYEHAWRGEGSSNIWINSGSVAGVSGVPSGVRFLGGQELVGTWGAYLYMSAVLTNDPFDSDTLDAFDGHVGELAADRFARLISEQQNLSSTLYGSASDTEPMGAQRPDTLLELLREIRDTDGGPLGDDAGALAISLRTRQDLYAQTPALALTYGVNVAGPFRKVLDDLDTHNVITATQRDGISVTVEDSTSSMGSQPPPDGVGEYKQEIKVNVADTSRLTNIASWWKAIGTNPEARYSAVTVDLDANPELETAAKAVKAGDRITVTGARPDLIDLIVIGKTDTRTNQKRRTITFTCKPYRVYDVAVQDATDKRQDSYTSTLNAGYNASVATMVVRFTVLADQWSQVNEPYDWIVDGERITVTSMGAVTGSGPWTQSATVTRSVNGVVKAHSSGAAVRMHPDQQARQAL